MIFTVTVLTACVKLLLIPAYKSTDFEVHRNWLAITHSLPLKKWYLENTSEWTLDYPPLFAYFEYLLSTIAGLFDRQMLQIDNLNYSSKQTVLFQRLSVIVTDVVYSYGAYKCCKSIQRSWRSDIVLPILLVTNCGLIMIDHVHFQYNGIMYGILLISIAYMLQGKHLASAFWFTVLLNMKHIYIYLAPAYFVYLLQHYCLRGLLFNIKTVPLLSFCKRLLIIGSVVTAVFLATFAPFHDHLGQVISRMFPFKRGLCHAYWAPNVWALYNVADKALVVILRLLGVSVNTQTASMTGGLVQEFSHSVLPSVSPIVTVALTAVMMLPALVKLWELNKHPSNFLRCLVLCALTSFLFGWHVHEKAILMAVIPLSILSVMDSKDARIFLLLSIVGHYSLFPLLHPDSLLLIKALLLTLYSLYAFHSLSNVYPIPASCKYSLPLLSFVESLYVLGLVILFAYENTVHRLFGIDARLPFLQLLLTSVYCSVGVVYCWVRYYLYFLKRSNEAGHVPGNKKLK